MRNLKEVGSFTFQQSTCFGVEESKKLQEKRTQRIKEGLFSTKIKNCLSVNQRAGKYFSDTVQTEPILLIKIPSVSRQGNTNSVGSRLAPCEYILTSPAGMQ